MLIKAYLKSEKRAVVTLPFFLFVNSNKRRFSNMSIKANHCENMTEVRANVDRIDRLLVTLMAERLNYIEQAARIKPSRDAVRDEDRIEDVIAKVKAQCDIDGFDKDMAERMWRAMMEDFIAHEFVKWDGLRK
jgi:isochorismate pyruvate lyase